MDDMFEKKLKEFLTYIIIIAVSFLIFPALLKLAGNNVVVNQIVLVGIFPLITFACGVHYAYKKTTDLWFCLIAPIVFVPTMFLYGFWKNSPLNCFIFLVAYLICGYIGLTVGEMIAPKGSKQVEEHEKREFKGNLHVRKRNVPKTVALSHHIEEDDDDNFDEIILPNNFEEEHTATAESDSDDFDYGYDIDSILNELRQKRDE